MKILLTVPVYTYRSSHPNLPDLGLGYLAAALRRGGHEVMVHDWNNPADPPRYAGMLRQFNPDIVGIKFFTLNTRAAQRTAILVREVCGQNTLLVLGGPHPSVEEKKWLRHDFPEADGRFIGEAEQSLVDFAAALSAGPGHEQCIPARAELPLVPGFDVLTDPDHVETTMRVIDDLDSLAPPAWDLIDPRTYPAFTIEGRERVLAPLMLTRGCPLGCKFCCTEQISGRKIRHHSPDFVLDQVTYLKQHHSATAFTFLDTNFMTDHEWLAAVVDRLAPLGREIVWNCVWGINPRRIDQHLLRAMYQAGCRAIIMGIESGDDQVRSLSGKHDSVAQVREQIELITGAGMQVHGFFMIGFPDESWANIRNTIQLAFSVPLEVLSFSILYPLPGTENYNWLKEKYSIPRIDWARFDIYRSAWPMSRLSSRHLSLVRRVVQVRNLLKPGRLAADIRRGMFSRDVLITRLKKMISRS